MTDYCIECGMCAVECPSNVNIPKLMLEAKSKYRQAHRGTPVDLLLGRAEIVSRLGSLAAPLANRLINQPCAATPGRTPARHRPAAADGRLLPEDVPEDRDIWGAALPAAGGSAARAAAPPQAARPSAIRPPSPTSTTSSSTTTTRSWASPSSGSWAAHGVDVVVPGQRSSGIPEMLYGYAGKARETAEFNLAAVLPYVKAGAEIVSAEPTATFAFKVHYPDYVNSPDCALVANATHDLGEYLVRRRLDHPETAPVAGPLQSHGVGEQTLPGDRPLRIGYHQPCHLKAQQSRQSGPGTAPRDPRRRSHRPGRRLLRDGGNLRHEGPHL